MEESKSVEGDKECQMEEGEVTGVTMLGRCCLIIDLKGMRE